MREVSKATAAPILDRLKERVLLGTTIKVRGLICDKTLFNTDTLLKQVGGQCEFGDRSLETYLS